MGKKHLNVAAVHARQAWWQKHSVTNPDASHTLLCASVADTPIVLDLTCDSDCECYASNFGNSGHTNPG